MEPLTDDGVLVLPVGRAEEQWIRRVPGEQAQVEDLLPVRFVPMTGPPSRER